MNAARQVGKAWADFRASIEPDVVKAREPRGTTVCLAKLKQPRAYGKSVGHPARSKWFGKR